jgi:hypothetical protein
MTQTAVQWLEDRYRPKGYITAEEFEQAKEMEKQQIINSHLTGLIHPLEMEATKQAEQYYNETYGGNDAD